MATKDILTPHRVSPDDLRVTHLLKEECIFINPAVSSRRELFDFISKKTAEQTGKAVSARQVFEAFMQRDRLGTTCAKKVAGLALPHVALKGLDKKIVYLVKLDVPVEYGESDDHAPINIGLFIFFLVPEAVDQVCSCHLSIFSALLSDADVRLSIEENSTPEQIYQAVQHWENENLPLFKYFVD